MILWQESEELYQKRKSEFRRVDQILVKCENCGDVRSVKYVTWKNQMRIMGSDLCISCRSSFNRTKYRESYSKSDRARSKSLSNTMKEKWSNKEVRDKYINNSGNRLSKSEFINKSKLVHNNKYDYYDVDYKGYLKKVCIVCPIHGKFYQLPSKHLCGHGCHKCGIDKTRLDIEQFINKSKLIHGNKYDYCMVRYNNTNDKVKIICKKHGMFMQSPNSHLSGSGCPHCSVVVSSYHNEVYEYIKSVYDGDVLVNNRSVLDGLEVDLYIPDKALALEINGLYWHSFDRVESVAEKTRHRNKRDKCFNKMISLFNIWEHLWIDKKDIIKSMIHSKIGLNSRIYARKCIVDNVSNNDFSNFMNTNHLQGNVGSSVKIGLYYGGCLVCAIGFNRNKTYEWEISRLASLSGFTVVGGISKLINKFVNDYNPGSIMTYASMDYSDGESYKKVGFDVIGTSNPGYFYYKGRNVYSRQQFQKHKLHKKLDKFNHCLTESQNMFNNGYRRCWNCGNIKLLKTFISK